MKRIAILGLGLMGGSLGLSLKAHGLPWHVAGFTRNAARGRRALKRGAVDSLHRTAAEAVQDADLVVLCGPVLALPQQARDCRPGLKPGAVVTDVGSTKAVADQAVRASLREVLDGLARDPARRLAMAEAARALAMPDAADRVADAVLATLKEAA